MRSFCYHPWSQCHFNSDHSAFQEKEHKHFTFLV